MSWYVYWRCFVPSRS